MTTRADTSKVAPVSWSRTHRAGAGELLGRAPGEDAGAVRGGGAGQRDDQPGVVAELPVEAEDPAAQPLRAQRGHEPARLAGVDPAAPGQRLARRAGDGAQDVAAEVPGPGEVLVAPGEPREQRRELGQRPDEVRRGVLDQDAALDRALVRDADRARGEVAQPAVHQLRAPAAGAEREVVLLDEDDAQAAGGRVERDPGAGDAAADDEHVDRSARVELGQFAAAPGGVERSIPGHRWDHPPARRATAAQEDP